MKRKAGEPKSRGEKASGKKWDDENVDKSKKGNQLREVSREWRSKKMDVEEHDGSDGGSSS